MKVHVHPEPLDEEPGQRPGLFRVSRQIRNPLSVAVDEVRADLAALVVQSASEYSSPLCRAQRWILLTALLQDCRAGGLHEPTGQQMVGKSESHGGKLITGYLSEPIKSRDLKSMFVRSRVWLGVLASVLIVGAVVAFSLTGSKGPKDQNSLDQSNSDSGPASPGDSPATGSSGTQGTSGTPTPGSTTKTDGIRAGPFGSSIEGKFRYRLTNSSAKSSPESREVIVEVRNQSQSADDLKQSVTFRPRGGDPTGRHQYLWSGKGTYLTIGDEWSFQSSCNVQSQGKLVHRSREQTSRVMEKTTLKVEGATLEVFVIHKTIKETSTSEAIPVTVETDATNHFAPALGLHVRMSNHLKISVLTETRETQSDWELLETKPN